METKPKRIAKRRRSVSPALKSTPVKAPVSTPSSLATASTSQDIKQSEPPTQSQPQPQPQQQEQEETPKKPKRVAKRRRTSAAVATDHSTETATPTIQISPAPQPTPTEPAVEVKKRKRETEEETKEVEREEVAEKEITASPSSSPSGTKRVAKRRKKLCKEQLPALDEEMDHLQEEEEEEPKLTMLPHHYLELKDFFQSLDVICELFRTKRREVPAFENVREHVSSMVQRNFAVRHLAQIKTIWPEAYTFQLDKQHNAYTEKQEYRLLIIPEALTNNTKPIVQRREAFHAYMLQYFQRAVAEMRMKGESVSITQFPEIPLAFLPRPEKEIDLKERHLATPMRKPRRQDSPIASPSSIRKKGGGAASLQQALLKKRLEEGLKNKGKEKEKEKDEEEEEKTKEIRKEIRKELDSRQSDIAPDIVNKVRRKEEQKLLDEKTGAAEMRKRQDLLNTLPTLCDMLRSFFVAEKKWCLEMGFITQKLISAYLQGHSQTLAAEDIFTRLHVLCQVVPGWLEMKEYSKKEKYLKLNKEANFLKTQEAVAEAMKNGFNFTLPPSK